MSPSKSALGKSRNGCVRCKARKIKCDETRPGCKRCERKGLVCPGYVHGLRWSRKHEVQQRALPLASIYSERVESLHLPQELPVLPSFQSGPTVRQVPTLTPSEVALLDVAIAPQTWNSERQDSLETTPSALNNVLADFCVGDVDNTYFLSASACDSIDSLIPFDPRMLSDRSMPLHQSSRDTPTSSERGNSSTERPLPWDYGLSVATRHQRSPSPRSLSDTPSALCTHFFKEVIGLYCAWDGPSNYLRALSEQAWQNCDSVYHTIQSMAAACLADDFPDLRRISRMERSIAIQCLRSHSWTATDSEAMLMALMLLGSTSSWHNPNDLAIEEYRTVENMVRTWQDHSSDTVSRQFFAGCMQYWEMLLSFLTDAGNLLPEAREMISEAATVGPRSVPHPFSGISGDIVKILAEVGSLVFRTRTTPSSVRDMTEQSARAFLDTLNKARHLEQAILSHTSQGGHHAIDPEDFLTPMSHFQLLDEAYRCTGLLQLCRVFPDLLKSRYRPWSEDDLFHPLSPTKKPNETESRRWLTALALHIVSLLRSIPFESRTRCVQPWLFVAVSSELRLNNRSEEPHVDLTSITVARARRFVSSRLLAYTHVLPLQKVRNVVQLVNLIWSELDGGNLDAFWVDIAYGQQLGTIMG